MDRRPLSLLLLLLPPLLGCAGHGGPATASTAPVPRAPEVHWDSAGVLVRSIPCDSPVVIHESSDGPGVRAEYAFLRQHYPGSRTESQALARKDGHPVDILEIRMPDGTPYSVCFDISRFFGRM